MGNFEIKDILHCFFCNIDTTVNGDVFTEMRQPVMRIAN